MPKQKLNKRADGRYEVKVYIGKVAGKKKYKTVYGNTVKEVNQKAQDIRISLNKGIDVNGADDSFGIWCDYYLKNKESSLTESRFRLIKAQVNVWKENLEYYKISKIRPLDLQPIVDSIAKCNPYKGNPSSEYTVKTYINVAKALFDFAIDNRVIEYNPASKLTVPKKVKPAEKRRYLTKQEQKLIMSFDHRGKTAMMLMMLSGLRKGEATALTWKDVDFQNKEIFVSRTYDFKNSRFKPPKNGKSRVVSMPDILAEHLKSLSKSSIYVVTSASNKMMSEQSWKRLLESYQYQLNEYCKENNLPMVEWFTYHCLRHTYATILHSAKVDVLTASSMLGHSDPKVTLDIYTHLEEETKKTSISELNNFLKLSV